MNNEKYVFAQLISFLNEDKFQRIVNKYQANRSSNISHVGINCLH